MFETIACCICLICWGLSGYFDALAKEKRERLARKTEEEAGANPWEVGHAKD